MRPPLQWTIDPISNGLDETYATYYADFGRGRYSVVRVRGFRAGTAAVAPPIGVRTSPARRRGKPPRPRVSIMRQLRLREKYQTRDLCLNGRGWHGW